MANNSMTFNSPFPLFGKPNHNHQCQWVYTKMEDNEIVFYICEEGNNILCEKFGFWFIEGGNIKFKVKNKD